MDKGTVLQYIRQADEEEIQELLQASIKRYKSLYPDWEIYFFSLKANDEAERREQLRQILRMAWEYGM
ncbi:MAG: hypothetical protein IJ448_06550 [Oscillospiraceae bacterium]|nr:hypothetical protein [Oscillospiraceae bacterium]